jgi:hypothetical protein
MEQARKDQGAKAGPAMKWAKRLGTGAFLFFLIKGLLWLLISALIAYFSLK